jgi:hypothetical protein
MARPNKRMTNTEKLLAIEAIKTLKSRYFQTIDGKDWDGYRALFTDDLVADMRASAGQYDESQLFHGADAYVCSLAPMLNGITTVHHGHMPDITIEDDNRAHGIWAMEDKLWVAEGNALPFRFLHGYGHYHEDYVCQDGQWRIQRIRLTRLHVELR